MPYLPSIAEQVASRSKEPTLAEQVASRSKEPTLNVKNIQGNITPGFNKDFQAFLFLKIVNVEDFRQWLSALTSSITSMAEVLDFRRLLKARQDQEGHKNSSLKATWVNIAFSHSSLEKLGTLKDGDFTDEAFREGLHKRSELLGDPQDPQADGHPNRWIVGGPHNEADVLLILASDDPVDLWQEVGRIETTIYVPYKRDKRFHSSGVQVIFKQYGAVLPEPLTGHEHFGFRDGISQPGLRGLPPDNPVGLLTLQEGKPGQDLLWPGEFIFGYPGQDPKKKEGKREAVVHKRSQLEDWIKDGSFLVFRRLRQDVGTFHEFLRDKARDLNVDVGLLGAKCVGRWASGAPILRAQELDNPRLAQKELENNVFGFQGDAEGRICPFASHIRKTYPRDDENQNENLNVDTTQTHRLLRRGIPYGTPSHSTAHAPVHDDDDRGLLFLAYQTSIVEQFEFVQRFANNPNLKANGAGYDPIIGQSTKEVTREREFRVIIKDKTGQEKEYLVKTGEKDWVIPTGGGYFFAPSIKALETLMKQKLIRDKEEIMGDITRGGIREQAVSSLKYSGSEGGDVMDKLHSIASEPQTNRTWEHLEDFVRKHVQQFIQGLLEEEVTELLGRTKPGQRVVRAAAPGAEITEGDWARIWAQAWLEPSFKQTLRRNPADAVTVFQLLSTPPLQSFVKIFDLDKLFVAAGLDTTFANLSPQQLEEIAGQGTLNGVPFSMQQNEWTI